MTVWIASAILIAIAAVRIAWPFLRGRSVEVASSVGTMSIYRDQMDEIERDHAAGLIGKQELDAARTEIERRALKAARTLDQGLSISSRNPVAAAIAFVLVAAASAGTYLALGQPGTGDRPLALRQEERLLRMADAGDAQSRIRLLVRELAKDPSSFEDWWMLANAYSNVGDNASAADAYRNAAQLSEDRPAVLSAYAEAMTLANGNKVPGAARIIFEKLAAETNDPRARYYLALSKAQTKDFEGAAAAWASLLRDSAPQAPWVPLVRRDLVNMARFLERDVTDFLPDASPNEIAATGGSLLPPTSAGTGEDSQAIIRQAERHAAAGDRDAAAAVLAEARQRFANAPFLLRRFDDAEARLGLTDGRLRGPSEDDIAAAAEMTDDERNEMISGMVAGLAARLESQPDDLDGWIMLVRSYATLGQRDDAVLAYRSAQDYFEGREGALGRLSSEVGEIAE